MGLLIVILLVLIVTHLAGDINPRRIVQCKREERVIRCFSIFPIYYPEATENGYKHKFVWLGNYYKYQELDHYGWLTMGIDKKLIKI